MGGKNTTISNMQPAAGNLRIQTSVYGAAIPLIYGTTRVSGNLVWFGGFKAIPHTTTTTQGGKGGGKVRTENTTFTYEAALIMAIGEGVLNNVLSAWKGKTRYSGVPSTSVPVAYTETYTVPLGGGTYTVAHAAAFLNDIQVTNPSVPETWDFTIA
jgi:hypothetical protein